MDNSLLVAVDVGSRCHRVAVGEGDGRLVDEFWVDHEGGGFARFFERIERWREEPGQPVRVAMEGYNGWARPLDGEVLARGWQLYNVNNLKLARYKELFPAPTKSDAVDARRMLELFVLDGQHTLAREVLQQVVPLPAEQRRLKYLTRRRRTLVRERTRRLTRLRGDLQALSPGLLAITGAVENRWFLRLLTCRERLTALPGLRAKTLAAIRGVGPRYLARIRAWQRQAYFAPDIEFADTDVVDDAREILALGERIGALNEEIERLSGACEPARRLRTIPGFGVTGVAELIGEIGTLERFASEASLAVYLGMAPLDHSSGLRSGARPARCVNERCRTAFMTCAARHMTCVEQSRAYYERKRAQGKTHNQAVRALGRHLVRIIWRMLRDNRDYALHPVTDTAAT